MKKLNYDILDRKTDILTAAKRWQVAPNGLATCIDPKTQKMDYPPEAWEQQPSARRELEDCIAYLSEVNAIKGMGNGTSYGLKHEIEGYYRHFVNRPEDNYVCNGSAILALMFLGFPLWVGSRIGSLNVIPGISAIRPWSHQARIDHERSKRWPR